jgi:hypothetical protein
MASQIDLALDGIALIEARLRGDVQAADAILDAHDLDGCQRLAVWLSDLTGMAFTRPGHKAEEFLAAIRRGVLDREGDR